MALLLFCLALSEKTSKGLYAITGTSSSVPNQKKGLTARAAVTALKTMPNAEIFTMLGLSSTDIFFNIHVKAILSPDSLALDIFP